MTSTNKRQSFLVSCALNGDNETVQTAMIQMLETALRRGMRDRDRDFNEGLAKMVWACIAVDDLPELVRDRDRFFIALEMAHGDEYVEPKTTAADILFRLRQRKAQASVPSIVIQPVYTSSRPDDEDFGDGCTELDRIEERMDAEAAAYPEDEP